MKINKLKLLPYDDKNFRMVVDVIVPRDQDNLDRDIMYYQNGLRDNKWLLEHLFNFRPWDHSYSQLLLADALEQQAKCIITYGHFIGHVKIGRKALEISKRIRKITNEEIIPEHMDAYYVKGRLGKFKFEKVDGRRVNTMNITYSNTNAMGIPASEYNAKMRKIAQDRNDKICAEYTAETYKLLAKWWPYFWD